MGLLTVDLLVHRQSWSKFALRPEGHTEGLLLVSIELCEKVWRITLDHTLLML